MLRRGVQEQCLTLVDELKQRTMDELTQGADAHTQNSYRLVVGEELGLRGLASARTDRLVHNFKPQAKTFAKNFRQRFSIVSPPGNARVRLSTAI